MPLKKVSTWAGYDAQPMPPATIATIIEEAAQASPMLDLERFCYRKMIFHEDVEAHVLHGISQAFEKLNRLFLVDNCAFNQLIETIEVSTENIDDLCKHYTLNTRVTALKLVMALADIHRH